MDKNAYFNGGRSEHTLLPNSVLVWPPLAEIAWVRHVLQPSTSLWHRSEESWPHFLNTIPADERCLKAFLHVEPLSSHPPASHWDYDPAFDLAIPGLSTSSFSAGPWWICWHAFGSLSRCTLQFCFRFNFFYRWFRTFLKHPLIRRRVHGGVCDGELGRACCSHAPPQTTLPPPCFTVGTRFFSWNAVFGLRPTCLLSWCPNNSSSDSSLQRILFQKSQSLSMFWQCLRGHLGIFQHLLWGELAWTGRPGLGGSCFEWTPFVNNLMELLMLHSFEVFLNPWPDSKAVTIFFLRASDGSLHLAMLLTLTSTVRSQQTWCLRFK